MNNLISIYGQVKKLLAGKNIKSNSGGVLVLVMGMITIMLIMGLTFLATKAYEQKVGLNHKDSIQAQYIAEAGAAMIIRNFNMDPQWRGTVGPLSHFGGTVTATAADSYDTDAVIIKSIGVYRAARKELIVKLTFPEPDQNKPGTSIYWALEEGYPPCIWINSDNAHDDAGGPNQQYASIISQFNGSTGGLGGFSIQAQPYPITKVEFILFFHLPYDLSDCQWDMQWQRISDNMLGQIIRLEEQDFNSAAGPDGTGMLSVELTDGDLVGGWYWELFTLPDIQILINITRFKQNYILNIDCVGFRITYGPDSMLYN